jgi:hypothetical protein
MRRIYLAVAVAGAVLLLGSAFAPAPTADQPAASGLRMVVGGNGTHATTLARLDKSCERGNHRCR